MLNTDLLYESYYLVCLTAMPKLLHHAEGTCGSSLHAAVHYLGVLKWIFIVFAKIIKFYIDKIN